MQKTKTPHIHAEVIKAWADGAEVEFRADETQIWTTIEEPTFYKRYQYRIKKTYEKRWLYAYRSSIYSNKITTFLYSEDGFKKTYPDVILFQKLLWTETEFEV